ncbi:TetR/AcrR family transcriptional regulator [Phytohabitans rumicis]|uniref:TetR family transcriptional regulator n=1 Tax=Phytohabitans rumicis TaxID=1076125 RepID=A0A6V8LCK7_9ACTN|nr:TetR/AcrR family transcriptional regulator [Phytohabitans rumicis]GFJ94952.1 TetR family transcriptional regulator [Phytohabitans rumicis]
MDDSGALRRQRGRPRDPEMEARVYSVVVLVFAEKGWAGFTLDEVARRSGVGKASVYLRWRDKRELLLAAMRDRLEPFRGWTHTGDLREDLKAMARYVFRMYWGWAGLAIMRLWLDARTYPDLFAELQNFYLFGSVKMVEDMVRSAAARGELPASTSPALVLGTLFGVATVQVSMAPPAPDEDVAYRTEVYVNQIVDMVLHGLRTADAGTAS